MASIVKAARASSGVSIFELWIHCQLLYLPGEGAVTYYSWCFSRRSASSSSEIDESDILKEYPDSAMWSVIARARQKN